MHKDKALVITDVVMDPIQYDLYSLNQMRLMNREHYFELSLLEREGFGMFFPLLTYKELPKEAIEHALKHGAYIKEVYIVEIDEELTRALLKVERTKEDEKIMWLFSSFFQTCQQFCVKGNYEGDSYTKMHEYATSTAIFVEKEDADLFKQIVEIVKSKDDIEEIIMMSKNLFSHREKIDLPDRFKWEYELEE